MTKIYVATFNMAKLNAVKEAFDEIIDYKDNYDIMPCKGESGVSKQPKTDEETLQGAINRAQNINYRDGFRIGLEGGVTLQNDRLLLINYGALIDPEGHLYTAGGARIELPLEMVSPIYDEGVELGDIMESYKSETRSHEGAIGIFTDGYVSRSDLFVHVIKLLWGQYSYQKNKRNNK